MAVAQNGAVNSPRTAQIAAGDNSAGVPGLPFPSGFKPPEGFLDEFWNDSTVSAELHITSDQRKRLQDAAVAQRLALIDSGADALKGFVLLSSILETEPFDNAAYEKRLNELASTTGKAVQNLGEMVVTPRRILTPEQWTKLCSVRKAKQAAARAAAKPTSQRKIPSSLSEPVQR
jgi:Spy/CpxP family protein refolding chaperone